MITRTTFMGGARYHSNTISGDVGLTKGSKRVQIVKLVTSSGALVLPARNALPAGGPYFYIINLDDVAHNALGIKDNDGNILASVRPNKAATISLKKNGWVIRITEVGIG